MPLPRMEFGRTGHTSTRVIFGGAALGSVSQDVADRALDVLLEHQVNHIDVAASYGDAELRVAPWLARHRDAFFVGTKTGKRTAQEAREELHRSLDRMKIDRVDLWQLHNLVDPIEWDRALSPCMTEGRSTIVVERDGARQTVSPSGAQPVRQRGRLALAQANPNSCQGGHRQRSARICKDGTAGAHSARGERMNDQPQRGVGIDVSQATLDVASYPDGEQWQISNDAAGLEQLVQRVRDLAPQRIVLEASGGYELAAVAALGSVGLPVLAVNPRQVRDFARSTGRLAKTDALDAQVLAQFASVVRPELRPLPDAAARELSALVARRRQLVEMRAAELTRLNRAHERVRPSIRELVRYLDRCIKQLDRELHDRLRGSPLWRDKDDLLRSIPGVGRVLSMTLLAEVPELGSIGHKQLAALIGLAPLNRDSGRWRGRRSVWGGRANVRAVLYMATLTAVQRNPLVKVLYERLRQAGKAHKVVMTACMHKLLRLCNAIIHHHTAWRYQPLDS